MQYFSQFAENNPFQLFTYCIVPVQYSHSHYIVCIQVIFIYVFFDSHLHFNIGNVALLEKNLMFTPISLMSYTIKMQRGSIITTFLSFAPS